jgi:hypothetical protein
MNEQMEDTMKRGNNYSKILTACFGVLFTLAASVAIDAQGRYANRYSQRQVSDIIATLEQTSNAFRLDFDRNLDQSNLNGTREEDRLNGIVASYETSLNRLRRQFDRNNNWWASRDDVQNVMNNAVQVNQMMIALPFARRLERQWANMRRDLNRLADTFDMPGLAGGGWNGGIGGPGGPVGGGGFGNAPSWAVGSFYGRNPQTGGTIQLVVNRNGQVTVSFDGDVSYGTMNGSNLNIGGARARVTRINNGIRTRRTDNGEVIDYYRGNAGGGGNYDGPIGGNVPNWAVGTFNARNPQDGSTITMTIRQNGEVYINFQNGGSAYGTIYGTTLTVNGETSTISQTNNGVRTTRTDNGERINYRRS